MKPRLERKTTGVFFGVYDRESSKYAGRLIDINTNGLMLMAKHPFEVGKELKLKMDLPQEIQGKSQFEFDGKIVWCKKCKNIEMYGAGLQFINIAPIYSQLIDELVASPAYNDAAAALPIKAEVSYLK